MPYFIYLIEEDEDSGEKTFTLLDQFDPFIAAKKFAQQRRSEIALDATPSLPTIKIIFSEDTEEAISLLSAKREAPILREWEK